MALHPDEWLKEAKKLPIGRTARVYHGAEHRPNLKVSNLFDRYTCYCHRCHEGGVVMKEFVRVQGPVVKVQESTFNAPEDAVPLYTNGQPSSGIPWARLVAFLHNKAMSVEYLKGYNPKYSASTERLILDMPDQTIGRTLRPVSTAKWLTYKSHLSYVRASAPAVEGHWLFLTEDCFSAIKAAHSLSDKFIPVALCGTVAKNDVLRLAMQSAGVVLCLDNDEAGRNAAPAITRALRLLDIPVKQVFPSAECDPKDMSLQWFKDIEGAINV